MSRHAWEDGVSSILENITSSDPLSKSEHNRLIASQVSRITDSFRRGLIRFVCLSLDASESSKIRDYRPSRLQVCANHAIQYATKFFDQNPISQLSLVVGREGVAERLSFLSGSSNTIVSELKKLSLSKLHFPSGSISLNNMLLLALSELRHVPDYGVKEILVLFTSLNTLDNGDIFDTVNQLIKLKIRVSIISLCAEVHVCKKITELTGGIYSVALDATHLEELMLMHVIPPPEVKALSNMSTEFVHLGFPQCSNDPIKNFLFDGNSSKMSYSCPRCYSRVAEVPCSCPICGLLLQSSASIARSYHFLTPLPNFLEVSSLSAQNLNIRHCSSCFSEFGLDSLILKCPICSTCYCVDCDIYIHDSLHNCPGCPFH